VGTSDELRSDELRSVRLSRVAPAPWGKAPRCAADQHALRNKRMTAPPSGPAFSSASSRSYCAFFAARLARILAYASVMDSSANEGRTRQRAPARAGRCARAAWSCAPEPLSCCASIANRRELQLARICPRVGVRHLSASVGLWGGLCVKPFTRCYETAPDRRRYLPLTARATSIRISCNANIDQSITQ
jgi:hypothetical protein